MKVVQLSSSDMIGGASVACRRLHLALRDHGVESTMAVKISRDSCAGIVTIGSDSGALARWREWKIKRSLARYAETRPWGLEMFSNPSSARRFSSRELPPADVVHLHWTTAFLDWSYFFQHMDRPWVWTLHDMNAFTGGCHYAGSCTRFSSGCGVCPQLGSLRDHDLSRRNWRTKRAALSLAAARRGIIVTPSHWLAAEAERSPIFAPFPIEVVPNGIDEATWCPQSTRDARAKLGLPVNPMTILFASEVLGNKRKGFLELVAALAGLPGQLDCQLISIGQGASLGRLPVPHRHLGSIRDEVRMAEVFNAADLFVIPSLEDNLPNTVLEAMACGTPVLGYRTGGIPEMVVDGETGCVVPVGDHIALASAMVELVRNPAGLRRMGEAARSRVLQHYTSAAQAKALIQVYARMMNGPGREASNG